MNPYVEISLVVYNNWECTKRLIDGIFKYTNYPNYKVILIDNCSRDCTVNELSQYETHFLIHYNEERKSWAACHNMVMSKTFANYVCLLSNEVVLKENWLSKLVNYADENAIGITVPVKNIDGRRLLGGKIKENGQCENIYEEKEEKLEWVHSCCMLIKTPVIREIEVFDERFKIKYFEEVDFCIRAVEAGFKIACCKDVVLDYYDNEPYELKTNSEANRQLFVEKHWDWIQQHRGKVIEKVRRPKQRRIFDPFKKI